MLDDACDNVIHKSPKRELLDDTRNNVVHELPSSVLPDSKKVLQKPKPRRTRLTQMTIDLGAPLQKRCRVCGMEYIPSNAEDSALHKKFHAQNLGGIELGKGFVESVRAGGGVVWTGDEGTCVCMVEKKDTLGARGVAMKRRVGDVLEVVRTELGAVEIAESELWSSVATKEALDVLAQGDRVTASEAVKENRFGRFKIYLYLNGSKCIGVCLAERILQAYKVLEPDDRLQGAEPTGAKPEAVTANTIVSKNSAISIAEKPDDAMLGISRIWTSTSYRKQGIATTLLDCAAENFLYGLRVDKKLIAFSQPTESGGCLARRWLATKNGWHVYTE
ncbi:hypothetical protein LTR16_005063 [Cryomyces antarcticus]|uniref:N-acetyltransferase ECO1 n=1 Tax=Cryomyces antarcticus TaxID=329879 RepID=A0ABR0KRC5_9PEZI|nr:hypothetical protein LTR16_005063 [Cryomyces antarcticus]